MRAFTVPAEVTKDDLLASLARHRAENRLMKGRYWTTFGGGRGCAVGCTIHDFAPGREAKHAEYERLFGIPESLAHLEDTIFEGLPEDAAQIWPERFVRAISPGADLSRAGDEWLLWLLAGEGSPLAQWHGEPWVAGVAALYRRRLRGDEPDAHDWAAARAAKAARDAARDAAWDAKAAAWHSMADALIRILEAA